MIWSAGLVTQCFDGIHSRGKGGGDECGNGADDKGADADERDVPSDELCGDFTELVDARRENGNAELIGEPVFKLVTPVG